MITKSTLDFIKEGEGVRNKVYLDSAGYPTIGVGHLIKPGEKFTEITDEEVDALLFLDLNIAYKAIEKYVFVTLNQNQFDALISLVFNIGVNAFRKSKLLKLINTNASRDLISRSWAEFRIAGGKVSQGLVNRRSKEIKLYFKTENKI